MIAAPLSIEAFATSKGINRNYGFGKCLINLQLNNRNFFVPINSAFGLLE
jgi:hypothetical protein